MDPAQSERIWKTLLAGGTRPSSEGPDVQRESFTQIPLVAHPWFLAVHITFKSWWVPRCVVVVVVFCVLAGNKALHLKAMRITCELVTFQGTQ